MKVMSGKVTEDSWKAEGVCKRCLTMGRLTQHKDLDSSGFGMIHVLRRVA